LSDIKDHGLIIDVEDRNTLEDPTDRPLNKNRNASGGREASNDKRAKREGDRHLAGYFQID
jgi:hypothetical protein